MLIAPIAHVEAIEMSTCNAALTRWGHQMGPCNRPNGFLWGHGLFEHGELVAVTVSSALINETCAGLSRVEAFELARLCASRPHLCRVMLRLWREFVFPPLCRVHGWQWAISYQDQGLHTGNTYRFDGWVQLGQSHSGTDTRSGRKGRNKTIWGWNESHEARASSKKIVVPSKARQPLTNPL